VQAMYNQLKVELYKLRTSRFFYLSVIGFLTASVMIYFANIIRDSLDITGSRALLSAISDTSLLFIMSLFVSYFIGNDFANRTIDNELRIGYSRLSVVLSRVIVALPFAAFLYMFYAAPRAILTGFSNGFGYEMTTQDAFIRIILFMLQVMAVMSFTALIMFCSKKASLGMMISVCFTVITCNIMRSFLDDNPIFKATSFYRIQMNSEAMTTQDITFSFVSAVATIFFVVIATYVIFRKTELK
jgi:ABC-2 type transport system permease protein